MKKYILLAVCAAFAASLHAQTTEDTIKRLEAAISLEMMKTEILTEGLTAANEQIIDLNVRLRNSMKCSLGCIGCSAASALLFTAATRHEEEHRRKDSRPETERVLGYGFAFGGVACAIGAIVNMWTPNVHIGKDGLVIKFGKPKEAKEQEQQRQIPSYLL